MVSITIRVMTILLPALVVAFAAFCVWLTVRIVNRRERWAKRILAATLLLPVLYVGSFGPACWLVGRRVLPESILTTAYRPCVFLALDGLAPVQNTLWWWTELCGDGRPLTDIMFDEALEQLKIKR